MRRCRIAARRCRHPTVPECGHLQARRVPSCAATHRAGAAPKRGLGDSRLVRSISVVTATRTGNRKRPHACLPYLNLGNLSCQIAPAPSGRGRAQGKCGARLHARHAGGGEGARGGRVRGVSTYSRKACRASPGCTRVFEIVVTRPASTACVGWKGRTRPQKQERPGIIPCRQVLKGCQNPEHVKCARPVSRRSAMKTRPKSQAGTTTTSSNDPGG